MTMTRRKFIAGGILGGIVATSMGGTDRLIAAIEGEDHADLRVSLADVTTSTADVRAGYLPDLEAFGAAAIRAKAPYYADAWAGEPLSSVAWRIRENYAFRDLEGESHRLQEARAEANDALPDRLRPLLDVPATVSGSPLLTALASAASLRRTDPHRRQRGFHLLIATDGIIIGDGVDSRHPVPAGAPEAMAAKWGTKLSALAGAQLYFTGVGLGSHLPGDRLDACEDVVRAVAGACGATVELWGARLGEAFPPYERMG